MKGKANARTPTEYIAQVEPKRRGDIQRLHRLVRKFAPELKPTMEFGMLGYGTEEYKYASGRQGTWMKDRSLLFGRRGTSVRPGRFGAGLAPGILTQPVRRVPAVWHRLELPTRPRVAADHAQQHLPPACEGDHAGAAAATVVDAGGPRLG